MHDLNLILEKSQFNSEEWHDMKPIGFDAEFKKYRSLVREKCSVQDFLTQHLLISEMLEEKLIFLAERHEYSYKWSIVIKLYGEFIGDLEIFFRKMPNQSAHSEIVQCLNSMILIEMTLIKKVLSAMRMNLNAMSIKDSSNPSKFDLLIIFFGVIIVLNMVLNFSGEFGVDINKLKQLPIFLLLLTAVMGGKLFCASSATNNSTPCFGDKKLSIYSNQKFNLLFIQKSTLKNKMKLCQNECDIQTTQLTSESFSH